MATKKTAKKKATRKSRAKPLTALTREAARAKAIAKEGS